MASQINRKIYSCHFRDIIFDFKKKLEMNRQLARWAKGKLSIKKKDIHLCSEWSIWTKKFFFKEQNFNFPFFKELEEKFTSPILHILPPKRRANIHITWLSREQPKNTCQEVPWGGQAEKGHRKIQKISFLATEVAIFSYLEAEKTAFWRPKGTGVSLARTTTLNARGPDMTE